MVYLGIFQDSNVKGGMVARHYVSTPNADANPETTDIFKVDDTESLSDIWERIQHAIQVPVVMGYPPVFEVRAVDRNSDAISLDQLLLNGAIGGRRLTKLMCMVLNEAGEPIEFSTYKIFDFKYRRMVPL